MSMNPPPPPPPPMPPGYTPYTPQPGGAGGGRPLASAWMRILARFLDGVIVSIAAGAVGAAIVLSDGATGGFAGFGGNMTTGQRFGIGLFGVVVGFLYEALTTKVWGGTPMKLAFGMKVVRAADGAPVGWNESLIRWGVPALIGVIPILGVVAGLIIFIINLIFLFTDKLRQTIWDKIAKTIVVTTR
jgi:uncharacterized RDD family membrane protein YckC